MLTRIFEGLKPMKAARRALDEAIARNHEASQRIGRVSDSLSEGRRRREGNKEAQLDALRRRQRAAGLVR